MQPISSDQIEHFLNGHNPKKYVVCIECTNYSNVAELIIHNPETKEKYIEKEKFQPFIYLRDFKKLGLSLYDNDPIKRNEAMKKHKITIKKLVVGNENGDSERLLDGYKFMATTQNGSYNQLLSFFKEGGIDIWSIRQLYRDRQEKYEEAFEVYDEANNKLLILEKRIKREEIKFLKFDDQDNPEKRREMLESMNYGKIKGKKTERGFLKKKNELSERIDDLKIILDEKKNELIPLEEEKEKKLEILNEIRHKKECFYELPIIEQFMISTGIRLFKGYEIYDDLEKLYFDIETKALNIPDGDSLKAKKGRIFLIGCRTNKGFREIIAPKVEDDDGSEKEMILKFFYLLSQKIKPAIVAGFNSENFDFKFIMERAEILGIDLTKIQTTFSNEIVDTPNGDRVFNKSIYKKRATLKVGGEKEYYDQKVIWGINNLDIWHSVRRAKAINSDIKQTGLKYIAKYAKVAKENRVYIQGNNIGRFYFENKLFLINKTNSNYLVIPEEYQNSPQDYKNHYNSENNLELEVITGKEIVTEYLQGDLEETEAVDKIFNESSFMLSKYIPSSFIRTATAGGASVWNLIMTTWSYEKNLAIPHSVRKRDFVGGLSRTYVLGRSKNILKADFSGLYPSIQLTHDIFPNHDLHQVLKGLLNYFRDTRNKYKKLAKSESDIQKQKFYDTKQLPLKILNNSMFGAFGSEYFNWCDYDKAEEITCRGRLYLRKMVKYFMDNGFMPVILDTDGVSLSVPEDIELKFKLAIKEDGEVKEFEFNSYEDGKVYLDEFIKNSPKKWKAKKGDRYELDNGDFCDFNLDESKLELLFDDLNDNILNLGVMKVDNDGRWESCITVARKNYANLEFNGKVKLVGNTIKSSSLPDYIEEFLNNGLKMLLKGKGKEFIEYYYSYVSDIYNKEIPLKKIASKSQVKLLPEDYKNRGNNKNGKQKNKQIHMELIIQNDLNVNLGDRVYYVNNGSKKKDSDSSINKETNQFNSYLIEPKELELNPDKKGEYNVAKYLESFNTRIESLLICFNENVIENLLVSKPEDRNFFDDSDSELIGWDYENYPFDKEELDSFEELFIMDNREVDFWNKVCMNPYEIFNGFKTNTDKTINIKYINKYNEFKERAKVKKMVLRNKNEKSKEGEVVILEKNDKIFLYLNENGKLNELREV